MDDLRQRARTRTLAIAVVGIVLVAGLMLTLMGSLLSRGGF